MRIALDLTSLIEKPTGVDRYLIGMAAALIRQGTHDYVLFINTEDRDRIAAVLADAAGGPVQVDSALPDGSTQSRKTPHVRVFALSTRQRPARLFFQQVLLPAAVELMRIDVVHSPTFIMPWIRGRAKHLLTVHDMTSFLLPTHHRWDRRGRMYEAAVSGSIRRADLVSVPSDAVRDDVLRILPDVSPSHVRAIPCGVDAVFTQRRPDEIAPVLDRLGIRWPYMLYLGTLDPRKNLPRLVEAYARIVARRDPPEHLVLGGQFGWSVSELLESLRQPALRDRVHIIGYVSEHDLPFVYGGARMFAYPSLLEGFGFPPLEAMGCGVPVVSADSSSLRNNLAGAAELVPPEDLDALTAAVDRMLSDEAFRAQYIAKGLERVSHFRWEAFARTTAGCYEEIAGPKSASR